MADDVMTTDQVAQGAPVRASAKRGARGGGARRPVPRVPDHEVIIVGAGISGMGLAIELRKAGIESFQLLERADDVGGTWRDNRYPGIAVDITSFTYSFSFEQNPDWSRVFAPGTELQRYAQAENAYRQLLRSLCLPYYLRASKASYLFFHFYLSRSLKLKYQRLKFQNKFL